MILVLVMIGQFYILHRKEFKKERKSLTVSPNNLYHIFIWYRSFGLTVRLYNFVVVAVYSTFITPPPPTAHSLFLVP